MIVKEDEYKGNAILAIYADEESERPIISFGFKKAEAVVEAIDEIRSFVEKKRKEKAR